LVCSCTTGIAALARERAHRADQHRLQALGEVRAAEELDGVLVLVGPLAEMHLPEVGGELGLLVATAGHVLVRLTTSRHGLRLPCAALSMAVPAGLALLAARLLVEDEPSQLLLHLADLVGLGPRRRSGAE
jgi:hypothetical protein